MAASGSQTIQLYYSTSSGTAPVAGNLANGELAINITDGKLYYKDNSGVVQTMATKGTALIGGSNTQVQYNNNGTLAGSGNLTFDGTTLTAGGLSGPLNGSVGATTPNTGAFTNLSSSGTVSGIGFSNYLASPPAIGGTTPAAGSFTTLSASGSVTLSGGTANGVLYLNGSKVATSGSALTFDGTNLSVGGTAPSNAGYTNLYLNNTTGAQLFLSVGGVNSRVIYSNSSGLNYYTSDASPHMWQISGSEVMRLTSTGLGIGTSSPQYKLHVAQSSSAVVFGQDSTTANIIGTNAAGTASQGLFLKGFPLTFTGNGGGGAEHMRLDSSGNLGLGVTPSAWASGWTGLQVGPSGSVSNSGTGTPVTAFSNNAYYNGTSWVYINTAAAAQYQLSTSQHIWRYAASGSGNITWSEAMRLDTSGNLGIGTTSPSFTSSGTGIQVKSASGAGQIRLTGGSSTGFDVQQDSVGQAYLWNRDSVAMLFGTANTERARITSGGNLLVGTTSDYARLTVDSGSAGLMTVFNSTNANGGYCSYLASGTTYGDIGTAAQAVGGSASDFGINARGSRNLVLGTNNTERARIDSSGRMGLGTTSPDSNYYLTVGITSSDTYAAARFNRGTTSSTTSIAFANPNGVVGTVSTSGTSTAYNTSSDYRLKHDIAPMTGALAKVAALKPVTYKWNTDNSNGEGFIAHELAEVVPQAVTGEKDAVDADGNPVYQGIDTSFLVATLTAAIQELNAKVQALEAQLNKGA